MKVGADPGIQFGGGTPRFIAPTLLRSPTHPLLLFSILSHLPPLSYSPYSSCPLPVRRAPSLAALDVAGDRCSLPFELGSECLALDNFFGS